MNYMNPCKLKIETAGSRVRLVISGNQIYDNVELFRLFPHTAPSMYIAAKCDNQLIGVIRKVSDLDSDSRMIVNDYLWSRYFIPYIKRIKEMKYKMHSIEWNVETDRGDHRFTTKALQDCLVELGRTSIITDLEGNRYYLDRKM